MNITAFKHDLGQQARDPISGFEGTIVGRAHHLYGCSQYGLAPRIYEGKVLPTQYFDEDRIEIVGPGVVCDRPREFSQIFMHPLGKKARDKVTNFRGMLTYGVEYLHGCNQYGLTPEVDKDGKTQDSEQFDEGRIEIVGDGLTAKDVEAPRRGGPNRDAP